MTRPRRLLLGLAGVLAFAGALAGPASADGRLADLLRGLQLTPLDPRPAPGFELERLSDGKRVALAEHRGRPVLLYFWATW